MPWLQPGLLLQYDMWVSSGFQILLSIFKQDLGINSFMSQKSYRVCFTFVPTPSFPILIFTTICMTLILQSVGQNPCLYSK